MSADEITEKISEYVQGKPTRDVLIALSKVFLAIFMQIPEKDERLKAFRQTTAKWQRALKEISERRAGKDVAFAILSKKLPTKLKQEDQE